MVLHTNPNGAGVQRIVDHLSQDSFSRLRVSNPDSIFDSKLLGDKLPVFWDEQITNVSGNATSVHSVTDAAVVLHAEAGDTIIRQTFLRFNYQPGKAQLFMFTGVLGAAVAGLTRRIGAFDADNGLFFELAGSTLSVVERKATVDISVPQSSWNVDTMDGTGPSGITLDTSKIQLFLIDFHWLGTGRVRYSVLIGDVILPIHVTQHANIFTSAFISTPNLPIRYEIISTTGTGDISHGCSTVIVEGGEEGAGQLRVASTNGTHVDANVADTVYAVVGIRLKSTHLHASAQPQVVSLISETNDDFEWLLLLNPVVAGTFTYGDETDSAIQAARGATANTVTGGVPILGGFVSTTSRQVEIATPQRTKLRLGSFIDGTPTEIVLCVRPLAANADIQGSLGWEEVL